TKFTENTMSAQPERPQHILDPGFELTLRPMRYPAFYEMYRNAIKNTWTVDEVDFSLDTTDLNAKMSAADRHLIHRLIAFFATGDTIVSNNLVLNLYQHINAPEARMYLSRQLYEEALHVQFYLTLLDTYIPDQAERAKAFAAIENIPSIRAKGEFCFKWIDSIQGVQKLQTREQRRQFLLNLICFAACIEGMFFFAAFAYVYYFRSRGLLHGLASGTNWVFRDESCHMAFAFEVVRTVRAGRGNAGRRHRLRDAVRRGRALRRRGRAVVEGDAPVPGILRRPAPRPARPAEEVRREEPVRLHGSAGRAGSHQLLRAPRLGLPGGRGGRGGVRHGVLRACSMPPHSSRRELFARRPRKNDGVGARPRPSDDAGMRAN